MIIPHDFGIELIEYEAKGKKNEFPLFEECPNCKCPSPGNLHRNGYYWRYAVTEEFSIRIPICRMKCLHCEANFSILPDFLIPYYQHTIHTILGRVLQNLEGKKSNGSRQLLKFHLNRYLKNVNWVHSFFVSLGRVIGMSGDIKKEAIKYMKMILDFGESPFLRRS
ncbi:DUF6431 domain-containing protein, partial [Heyndrickxia sporothermodurans]